MWRVPADLQNRAIQALMRTLSPSELALPISVINAIPPRPPGFGRSRELFPRYTGGSFDAVTPAVVSATHTVNSLLTPDRAARMVEQALFDESLPGLENVLGSVLRASFGAQANGAYEEQVKRAVEGVVVDRIQWLAANAPMPEVREVATATLQRMHTRLSQTTDSPHATIVARNIQRFLDRPAAALTVPATVSAPPGAPIGQPARDWLGIHGIGQPAQDWLSLTEPWCTWEGHSWD